MCDVGFERSKGERDAQCVLRVCAHTRCVWAVVFLVCLQRGGASNVLEARALWLQPAGVL